MQCNARNGLGYSPRHGIAVRRNAINAEYRCAMQWNMFHLLAVRKNEISTIFRKIVENPA